MTPVKGLFGPLMGQDPHVENHCFKQIKAEVTIENSLRGNQGKNIKQFFFQDFSKPALPPST